jgi:hypothetical protein
MKLNNEAVASNGNVNVSRDTVNKNMSRLGILGKAKRFSWNANRSFRSY